MDASPPMTTTMARPAEDPEGWHVMYTALRAYKEAHRDQPLLLSTAQAGYDIGGWAWLQRQAFEQGTLALARVALLEALPGWEWNHRETAWQTTYAAVKAYLASRPPQAVATFDGGQLGKWVATQRIAYKAGTISPTRAAQLEALPGWAWDPYGSLWLDTYRAVEAYATKHHALPGSSVIHAGRRLNSWVADQRYAHKCRKLTPERVALMEALPGWTWELYDLSWQGGYDRLRAYMAASPHRGPPPKDTVYDGANIGSWADRQRRMYRTKALQPTRVALLEAVPGWTWKVRESAWMDMYGTLRAYMVTHQAMPPSSDPAKAHYYLGQWARYQQHRHRCQTISAHQAGLLEALPGWTWPRRSYKQPGVPVPPPGTFPALRQLRQEWDPLPDLLDSWGCGERAPKRLRHCAA